MDGANDKMINRRSNIRMASFIGILAGILMLLLSGKYVTPDFVANHLSPDGILQSNTIIIINHIRIASLAIGVFVCFLATLFLFKPNLLTSIADKLTNISLTYKRMQLVLGILSVMGVILILYSTSLYGVALSPDSTNYICCARHILSGNGYTLINGNPMVVWPPLFSTLLAGFGFLGVEPLDAARLLNAFVFGLIIYTSGQFFLRNIESRMLSLLATLAVILSIPLFTVSIMAWTEPLFILLVLLFVIYLAKFLNEQRLYQLLLISAIASLSCLQRYIGVTLILTGFGLIIFCLRHRKFSERVKNAVVFSTLSAILPAAWILRNYLLTSTLTGGRYPSSFGLSENVKFAFETISGWVLPESHLIWPIGAVILFGSTIATIVVLRSETNISDRSRYSVISAAVFIFIYTIFLLLSATFTAFDRINDRLLSPLYVFLLFIIVFVLDRVLQNLSKQSAKKSVAVFTIFSLFIIWLAGYPALKTTLHVFNSITDGAGGYSTTAWRQSSLIGWLRNNRLDGKILSNAPDALYILTGISSRISPRKHQYASSDTGADDLNKIKSGFLRVEGKTYLVWHDKKHREYLYDPEELRSVIELRKLVTFSDGQIYRLAPQ